MGSGRGRNAGEEAQGSALPISAAQLPDSSQSCSLLSPLSLHWKHQLLFIHLSPLMPPDKSYLAEGVAFLVSRRNT